ncbi:single-stranded DNA-binding protein [Candidatus Riflebacteria bacterium]
MNLAIVIGRLTRDPEMRFTSSGQAMCKFDLAVNRPFKSSDGEWREEVTYIPIVVWGKQAESCDRYLKKGSQTAVHGRITIRSYEDREGIKRKATQIDAQRVEFLGSRSDSASYGSGSHREDSGNYPPAQNNQAREETEEDIPF